MKSLKQIKINAIKRHFVRRERKYDYSSSWVDDKALINRIFDLSGISSKSKLLDIATGTGKIARVFHKKSGRVIGLDLCREMACRAKKYTDGIVVSQAEDLPFKDRSFDYCVCRQGLQFMDVNKVLAEMRRILKPKGSVLLCHLTAYGGKDKETAFLIQRLRNPARKNFFLPEDFISLLKKNGFREIKLFSYITRESVNQWIGNAAIDKERMKKIKDAYKKAPNDFLKTHKIGFVGSDILDSMKMVIVRAKKSPACKNIS